MSQHGKVHGGKTERRKEIAQIAMMHPRTFVAQTTCAHTNHFYRSVLDAMEFDGPSLICCYTTCQPEHGVADHLATDQARLAVDTRAFPLLAFDPRKGDNVADRLSLQGNPAVKSDWWKNPKTGQTVDFIDFCRSEGRFVKHFDHDGKPSETLLKARQDRLENWQLLQELAGLRGTAAAKPAKAADRAVAPTNGDRLPAGFTQGTRIKYHDGDAWIPGVLSAADPVVLSLDDATEIRTTADVLHSAVREGLVSKR